MAEAFLHLVRSYIYYLNVNFSYISTDFILDLGEMFDPSPTITGIRTGLPVALTVVDRCFRQISGAMIRISNCEDREGSASTDRTITITGNPESVALAQYLINMR